MIQRGGMRVLPAQPGPGEQPQRTGAGGAGHRRWPGTSRTWSRCRSGSTTSSATRPIGTAATSEPSSTSCLLILPPERIFAITTPDHKLTEWGQAYGSPEAVRGPRLDPLRGGLRARHRGHRHRPGERARGPGREPAWCSPNRPRRTPPPSSTPAGSKSSGPTSTTRSPPRSRSRLGASCRSGPVRPDARSCEASKEEPEHVPRCAPCRAVHAPAR